MAELIRDGLGIGLQLAHECGMGPAHHLEIAPAQTDSRKFGLHVPAPDIVLTQRRSTLRGKDECAATSTPLELTPAIQVN